MRLFEVDTGREWVVSPDSDKPAGRLAAFHPDGKRLAVWSAYHADTRDGPKGKPDAVLTFWDLPTGQVERALPLPAEANNHPSGLHYTADGRRLVGLQSAGFAKPGGLWVWDAETDRVVFTTVRKPGGEVVRLPPGGVNHDLSADGRSLAVATGDEATIRVLDVATGQTAHTLRGHVNMIAKLAISPDGSRLASVGWAAKGLEVRVWDLKEGQEVLSFPLDRVGGSVRELRFDGRRLLMLDGRGLRVYDGSPADENRQ
jgi:WD40 repeat protein